MIGFKVFKMSVNKRKCKNCGKDLRFNNAYKIKGLYYGVNCWINLLRKENGNKKLPEGYGPELKVLETMVKMRLTGKFHLKSKDLRVLAIKALQKDYPVIMQYMI